MTIMTSQTLMAAAKAGPVDFKHTMQVIDHEYDFTETQFKNGKVDNPAGSNNGSCKLLAFAQLHSLDKQSTLHLFGNFYTQDVLENPDKEDHQNIRNFMAFGWEGVVFEQPPLTKKPSH